MCMQPSLKKNRSFLLSSIESCQEDSLSTICSHSPQLILSSLSDSLSCNDEPPPSSSFIFFPQSLWVLIDSHWIRSLLKSSLVVDLEYPHRLRSFQETLLTFFTKAYSLGERFFTSAVLGTQHFFESSTFPLVSRDFLPLTSLASFFKTGVRSVYWIYDDYFETQHIQYYRHLITRLGQFDCNRTTVNVINPSSSLFLPNLRRLHLISSSDLEFSLFCKFLEGNSSIIELDLCLPESVTSSDLEAVFLTNSTLKNVSLSNLNSSFIPTISFFNCLTNNTEINVLNLFNMSDIQTLVLLPLLCSSTLKTIVFPRGFSLDFTNFDALKNNSSIQEVSFHENEFSYGIVNVLNSNTTIKKLEMSITNGSSPSIFKSLESNTSLLELIFHDLPGIPRGNEVQSIESMLRHNSNLIVLNLDMNLNSFEFRNLLDGILCNSGLKKVFARCLDSDLNVLMKLFKIMKFKENTLSWCLEFSPHLIDLDSGVFSFFPTNSPRITDEQVSSLKCFLEAFNIKTLTLKGCRFSLKAITDLCDLIRVNNTLTSIDFRGCLLSKNDFWSIIDALQLNCCLTNVILENDFIGFSELLDIYKLITTQSKQTVRIINGFFSHLIDITNGVFCFSPTNSPCITDEQVSSFLECFNIKKLTLKGCRFSLKAITDLCDLIRVNTTLTSIDFRGCLLSKNDFWSIIDALQLNCCLTNVILENDFIGLSELLNIYTLFHTQSTRTLPSIKISHSSINFDDGSLCCDHQVDYSDLISLLETLKSDVSIKRVECRGLKNESLEDLFVLFEILSINKSLVIIDISPHLIDITNGVFCYSPANSPQIAATQVSSLKCFLECFNIKQLTLRGSCFSSKAIPGLCDLIRVNNTLTSIDFRGCLLSENDFWSIIDALQLNFCLSNVILENDFIGFSELLDIFTKNSTQSTKTMRSIQISRNLINFDDRSLHCDHQVDYSDLILLLETLKSDVSIKRVECRGLKNESLEDLFVLFEILSINKSLVIIDISPHLIDIEVGSILYDSFVQHSDLISLLETLKSDVSIKRVECRGLENERLEDLFVLFEILSINKSLVIIDISPHLIDITNGVFCYSPANSPQIAATQVSSLKCFLECFNIKQLTLRGSCFSSKAIPGLCDLIRVNNTLTSIDFRGCLVSENDFWSIIDALQLNFCLSNVILENDFIGFSELLDVFTKILLNQQKQCEVDYSDLILLLETLKSDVSIKRVECRGLKNESLEDLFVLFEILSINKSLVIIDISPHLIDIEVGSILYDSFVQHSDLISLLETLKSDVSIKRVECRGLENESLEDLFVLFEILSINKSLVIIDISPHLIDITNGVYTSLIFKVFLEAFNIKQLTLKGCRFSLKAITDLCDLIRVNNTLTSIDFRGCLLSKNDFWSIIDALQLNCCLTNVILENDFIGLSDLMNVYKLFPTQSSKTMRNIQISRNLINIDDRSLHCDHQVDYSDLILLLETLKSDVSIKRVECRGLKNERLEDLLLLFEILSINKSLVIIDISPHLIDLEVGSILYDSFVQHSDLISLLETLKSDVSIKRVECRGLKNERLEDLLLLFEILSINKSLVIIDISPHLIDITNGVFCYSPTNSPQISAAQVSSLKCFWRLSTSNSLLLKDVVSL
ncbi:hypothetical protein GEMRC1_006970 [Eukaryota sp. GEM-RC1]